MRSRAIKPVPKDKRAFDRYLHEVLEKHYQDIRDMYLGFALLEAVLVGESGVHRGSITLVQGMGGNEPAYIKISSADGTVWYLFIQDDGTINFHNDVPTQNGDGTAVASGSAMVCTAYLQTTMLDGVLPDTTDNLVLLDNTLVNTGSKFDAGNNRITITDAGNYLVTAQIHVDIGNDVQCYLRVKDSDGNIKAEQAYRPSGVSGVGEPMIVSKAVAMSAGKWLALYEWHASGANQVNGNAEGYLNYPTYLSVTKI